MSKSLPPQIGVECNKPLLYSPYQQEFLKARRQRFCKACNRIGFTGPDGLFKCPVCAVVQQDAPRVYTKLGCFAGRRGGKSVVGAHGAREEMLTPNSLGWVCGPTYDILEDATMPTLLKLIPREWVANWKADTKDLTLINGAKVSFRSLNDPDRGHAGVGLHWAWLDEAAFISELAWDYLSPALTDFGGAAFFTSSVDGYDWTYERIEKKALIEKKPGYWAAKWRTIDNPWMAIHRSAEIEEARASNTPQMFRQEYEGARENFTGAVYGEWIDNAWLADDAAVREYIPEWPAIIGRKIIIPLDSGTDHPFGALALVPTDKGVVVVSEYLERQRAFSTHLGVIKSTFPVIGNNVLWGANRNEAALRMEFAAHGVAVAPAENDQMAGIQRVLSWLYVGQLKFAHTCPRAFEQMKTYRYAKNESNDKQKLKEKVFKLRDELPDCIRYGLMLWPSLPKTEAVSMSEAEKARWAALDEKSRMEIQAMREFHKNEKRKDMESEEDGYPGGSFFGIFNQQAW